MTDIETFIHREKGKRWKLPKIVNIGDSDILIRPHFYEVVEYRKPKKGEWYLSGATPEAYKAPNDLSQEYLVIELKEEAVQRMVWRRKDNPKEEKGGLYAISEVDSQTFQIIDRDTNTEFAIVNSYDNSCYSAKQRAAIIQSALNLRSDFFGNHVVKIKISQGIILDMKGPKGLTFKVIECDKYGDPIEEE